jgi:hypothetical protein
MIWKRSRKECFEALLADNLQNRVPVGADETDFGSQFIADNGEEFPERFDAPLFGDPEQTGDAEVDLVDECQVLVTFGVLDFVDSDGVETAFEPMRGLTAISILLPSELKRACR